MPKNQHAVIPIKGQDHTALFNREPYDCLVRDAGVLKPDMYDIKALFF